MDDFRRPQRPPQRPIHDFGPRPQQRPQGPITDLRPLAQQPLNQPAPPSSHPPQQKLQEVPQTPQPLDFSPPAKKKRQISKPNKTFIVLGVTAVLVVGSFVFINSKNRTPATQPKAQQETRKPFETPSFTTYYPNPMPTGLSTVKDSIAYYKDSFTFIMQQNGQKFFVYEQPAATDPNLASLKSKLAAPKKLTLSIGQGIEGNLDIRTITALKTDKDTNITISCSKAACNAISRQILSNMKLNSDLANLQRTNQ